MNKQLLAIIITFALASNASAQTLNPSNGHWYEKIQDFGIDWDGAKLAAEGMIFQGMPGHLVTITDQAENDWLWASLDVPLSWIGMFQDALDPSFAEPGGGWKWVTGEPIGFTAWNTGEPNDNPAGEDTAMMEGANNPNTWNDLTSGTTWISGYIVEWEGVVGTNFCQTAMNSSGSPASISAMGSASVTSNDLALCAGPVPVGEPGIFYYGPDELMGIPFGDGFRCIGGPAGTIERLFPFAIGDAAGTMTYAVDNTAPAHSPQLGLAGSTWKFQAWFRDPLAGMTGFNLSDGLSVTFLP